MIPLSDFGPDTRILAYSRQFGIGKLRTLAAAIAAVSLLHFNGWGQIPVQVKVISQSGGSRIPVDFVGMSFGMKALLPDKDGNHFFNPTNKPLVTLFQNLGISHLRVGGTTVESPPNTPIPDQSDIDSLFAFVEAAGVKKVIYSLRLLETNAALGYDKTNAIIAKYIWDHYRRHLDCFSIGNEPDRRQIFDKDESITNFATYLAKWRKFAGAVTNAVPEAKFAGPDAGSGNVQWTTNFAAKELNSGLIAAVSEHFYVGGAGRGISPEKGIADMLSARWVGKNQSLHDRMAAPVLAEGLPYRFTEANDHYSGGVRDASDTFAGALWALDFLHWWAAHGARGVDFHNTQWVVNDVITLNSEHQVAITPKGYGLRAFELCGGGAIEPAVIENPSRINFTAYAVRGESEHFITLINKGYGPAAQAAGASVLIPEKPKRAEVMFLESANGDVTAGTGVTLGGGSISADGAWEGRWLPAPLDGSGHCVITVRAASAAIVRIYVP